MFPKNSMILSLLLTPKHRFASVLERLVLGTVLLIPNGMTLTLLFGNMKLRDHLAFHSIGVNENMVAQVILSFQRKPIKPRIVGIPLTRVHVVGGEDDSFTHQFVIKHQQGAVE